MAPLSSAISRPLFSLTRPDIPYFTYYALSLIARMKYSVFQSHNYNKMATGVTSPTSFEYAHNQVHHAIGGFNSMDSGHMGVFSYAAFDPILYPCLSSHPYPAFSPFLPSEIIMK